MIWNTYHGIVSQRNSLHFLYISSHFMKAILASCALNKMNEKLAFCQVKEIKGDFKQVLLYVICLHLPKEYRGLPSGNPLYWKEVCGCILFGGGGETADYIALKQNLYIHTYF